MSLCLFVQPPRPCDDYWSEFRHCKSFLNRFHHYYTHGTFTSCQQWKEDYHNCKEWEKHRGTEAKVQFNCLSSYLKLEFLIDNLILFMMFIFQEALLKSERNRVAEQKSFTPVWTLRQDPPRDWHMPLNQERPQDPWAVTVPDLLPSLCHGSQNEITFMMFCISLHGHQILQIRPTCWRNWLSLIAISGCVFKSCPMETGMCSIFKQCWHHLVGEHKDYSCYV